MKANLVVKNATWIIACKIVQSIIQLIIGMFSARYLGPYNYGLINYAASIVAFALPIMQLGLRSTLVYELVETPEKEGEIMGTSLLMNTISSLLCILGVAGFASVANFGEPQTIIICILYSISLFFAALEMMQYWFQYKLLSKYSSSIMLFSYIVVSAYKIFLLVCSKSVYWFAVTHSIEYGIIGISLIAVYIKNGGQKLCFSLGRARKMISRSKYYILSAMMVVIIQNIDHIMITSMISKEENGFYSAAITSATVVQFIYLAIVDSFRPIILASKKENPHQYEKNISCLYGIIIYLTIAQSIVFTVFAKLIISILYGADYAASIPVLQILVWYVVFSAIGVVRNVWILAEDKQKYLWIINLSGALFNIGLNAVMIPFWGACGAAFASLLTQCFANFLLGFIMKPLRPNNQLMLKGIRPKFLFYQVKLIVNELKNNKTH